MAATQAQKVDETFDQLDNIESLCELFFREKQFTIYKSISAALRLLLVGSSGDAGLADDVLPAASLLPLIKSPDPSVPPGMLILPAPVSIVSGEARVQFGDGMISVQNLNVQGGAVRAMEVGEMFDRGGTALPLNSWLDQTFLRPDWTVELFIRTVANKDGGAHLNPNAILLAMQKWGHFHSHLTAGIGRSIVPQIRTQLLVQYPQHVRLQR